MRYDQLGVKGLIEIMRKVGPRLAENKLCFQWTDRVVKACEEIIGVECNDRASPLREYRSCKHYRRRYLSLPLGF